MTGPAPSTAPVARGRRLVATVAVLLGMFMEVLDSSVLNVALPTIAADLGAGEAGMQWAVAGYALPFALGLITGGRLGDLHGRRRVFVVGAVAFVATSVVCGLAPTAGLLVAGRVLQGLAAALMLPQAMATIHVLYPPRERGAPLAAAGALFAVTTVTAPVLGALLLQADVLGTGWRAIFFINVPIGALALVAVLVTVPESRSSTAARLDLAGVGLVSAAMLTLLVPIVTGRELGWPVWTLVALVASPVLWAAFAVQQRRRRSSPLVEPSLFGLRSFVGGGLVVLLAMGAMNGFFFVLTIYLQTGQGYSLIGSAVTSAPWGIASAVAAGVLMSGVAARFAGRVVAVGMVVSALALVWVALVVAAAVDGLAPWALTLPMVVGGVGMGTMAAFAFDAALSEVPADDAGSASGVLNTVMQVSGAVGVALVGTVYFALSPPAAVGVAATGTAFAGTLALSVVMLLGAAAAALLLPVSTRTPAVHQVG